MAKKDNNNKGTVSEIEKLMKTFESEEVKQFPSYFDFRLGWGGNGRIDTVPKLLRVIGVMAHHDWLKAMERGDAPPEDVSPCEGFFHYANLVEGLMESQKDEGK